MDKHVLRVPGTLKHSSDSRSEADLQKEMRAFLGAQPGIRFVADVLTALHAQPQPLRQPRAFYSAFPPRQVLPALTERPELRVRLVRAITGGPPTLLRRLAPADLAAQIELLVAEDLPATERALRAEEDRSLSALDLYLKYLEPSDLAAYIPVSAIWEYESQDAWWTREAGPSGRALMAAELKSIRKHVILTDSEFLDIVGDETLERDLPISLRTNLRAAARKAAREGRPFKDSDLFSSVRSSDTNRDLTDELAENVSLTVLRKVVVRAAEILGLTRDENGKEVAVNRAESAPIAIATSARPPSILTARGSSAHKAARGPIAAASGARERNDTPLVNPVSRTPPVSAAEAAVSALNDDEVVSPDNVVMIDEIPS